VDVAVVHAAGPGGEERAYIANRKSQTISIVDVALLSLEPVFIPLAPPGGNAALRPVAIAARSDGKRLFTADSTDGSISVIDINSDSGAENTRVREIPTGPSPNRLTILRLP